MDWNESQPIYRQLRERIVAEILDGSLPEGEALPSIRQVSVELKLNPLTVGKAYQDLLDADLIEKRRGLGMYVKPGARQRLLQRERERFLSEEWPQLKQRLLRLGITLTELFESTDPNTPT